MSSENTVADRLLTDARKKTAKNESPTLSKIAMIVGVLGVLVSWIPIAGWVLGAVTVGLGSTAVRRPVGQKHAKIAITLGVAAILIGVFFFTLTIASR